MSEEIRPRKYFEVELDISVVITLPSDSPFYTFTDLIESNTRSEPLPAPAEKVIEYKFKYIPNSFSGMGGVGKYTLLTPEVARAIVQLTSDLSHAIVENKTTLDIITDFAVIIGTTIPLVGTVMRILHLTKPSNKSYKIPTVSISIGDVSVTVTNEDLKDAEHAATNIARKLLKEHPEALLSRKVKVEGKLVDPPTLSKRQQKFSRTPRKRNKRKRM